MSYLTKITLKTLQKNNGFSLIEMIVVIILLGALSLGISSFINFGTRIYTDATDRDEVVSSARFAIERLNREVRSAVPNSIRINGNNVKQCIEFTPIILSAIYTDILVDPDVVPEEDDFSKVNVIVFDKDVFDDGFSPNLFVGVYLLNAAEFYSEPNSKIFRLNDNTIDVGLDNEWTIQLSGKQIFAQESPTNRLYFFNDAVSYCVQNSKLTRHQAYTRNIDNTPISDGVLMADFIDMHDDSGIVEPPFWLTETTQLRNALVLIKLSFERNNERITFNNEIQVPNVS
jgi:MSHA biogenesis protein MshO